MVAGRPNTDERQFDLSPPLTLKIVQGRGGTCKFPVRIRNLSARGVTLATGQTPGNLNLEGAHGRESVIHLPEGEISEIRGTLLYARPGGEGNPETIFGLEFATPNLKVRRALEEHLLAHPQDLKNMWDNWDALQEELEASRFVQTSLREDGPFSRSAGADPRSVPVAPQAPKESTPSDHTVYWVGIGAVLGGLSIYFLAPEKYLLFGVILAVYGSLTIAGKSIWTMWQRRAWSQE